MKNLALVCHSERQRRIFFMLTRKILRLRCASLRMTVRGNALRFAQGDIKGGCTPLRKACHSERAKRSEESFSSTNNTLRLRSTTLRVYKG